MEHATAYRNRDRTDLRAKPHAVPTASVIGIDVSALSFDEHVERIVALAGDPYPDRFVCVANVHMLVEARQRPEFRKVLETAALVTPDGMPLVWLMRRRGSAGQERVAGMDLLPAICVRAAAEGAPVYFMGATQEVLDRMRSRLQREIPDLKIAGMSAPPFRPLTPAEDRALVESINRSGAEILLIALGCPKQEEWMYRNRHRIRPAMVGLGAAFGVYAGLQRRAPGAMQRSGLEWLFRLSQEPKRLWKRYLMTNLRFLAYVFGGSPKPPTGIFD